MISVTTLIYTFFDEFNADAVIEKYYNRWQQNKSKTSTMEASNGRGQKRRQLPATKATILHAAIEAYYNGNEIECMIQRGRRVVAFPSFSKKHLNSLHIGQR